MNESKGEADAFIFEGTGEESSGASKFMKGADFDTMQTVEFVSMTKFTPDDSKYGATHTYGAGGKITKENYFVKNGLLTEGQSFKYTFKQDGLYKEFDNSSVSFYFAFTRVNPKAGEVITIKRTKQTDVKVDWAITKV